MLKTLGTPGELKLEDTTYYPDLGPDIDRPYEFLDTMLVLDRTALEDRLGDETLIVCGSSRGMTSFVSFTLYELDYFIGSRIQANNFEDEDMRDCFPQTSRVPHRLTQIDGLRDLVERRNGAHRRWGFKLPMASNYVRELPDVFRNPICVLCVRNPVGTARSMRRREDKLGGISRIMYQAQRSIHAIQNAIETKEMPTVIINMDEAHRNPQVFLDEFTSLLKIEGDTGKLAQRLKNKGYKRVEPKPGITLRVPGA